MKPLIQDKTTRQASQYFEFYAEYKQFSIWGVMITQLQNDSVNKPQGNILKECIHQVQMINKIN
ncbi:unnamed protein product [Paramecium sonneborni]|uniref:Uncharacterized protein n=1 Tax=Paramecium sonneborni TaxID=65129 RepID=A0A8S1RR17_9CILI|nr:unnamed protein product [Paramecium sonneborni]